MSVSGFPPFAELSWEERMMVCRDLVVARRALERVSQRMMDTDFASPECRADAVILLGDMSEFRGRLETLARWVFPKDDD